MHEKSRVAFTGKIVTINREWCISNDLISGMSIKMIGYDRKQFQRRNLFNYFLGDYSPESSVYVDQRDYLSISATQSILSKTGLRE